MGNPKFKLADKWKKLSKDAQNAVLFGTSGKVINFVYDDGMRTYKTSKPFEGVVGNLERRWRETDSTWMRDEISKYMSRTPCPDCDASTPTTPRS